jgi:hypothetical protein
MEEGRGTKEEEEEKKKKKKQFLKKLLLTQYLNRLLEHAQNKHSKTMEDCFPNFGK